MQLQARGVNWTLFSITRAEEELAAQELQAKETGSRKPKLNKNFEQEWNSMKTRSKSWIIKVATR